MEEPSVLDYLKSLLDPRRPRIQIPWDDDKSRLTSDEAEDTSGPTPLEFTGAEWTLREDEVMPVATAPGLRAFPPAEGPSPDRVAEPFPDAAPSPAEYDSPGRWPWLSLLALVFALVGQNAMEPPDRDWQIGVALYLVGAALLAGAYFRKEWQLASLPRVRVQRDPLTVRNTLLLAAVPFAGVAFIAFGGNGFDVFNVTMWLIAIGCLSVGLWLPNEQKNPWWPRFRAWLANPQVDFRITPWMLLVIAAVLVSLFFRFYRLDSVPPEMISDHAEKLWDVRDLINGEYRIYFERNTGREPFQFYWTALMVLIFDTGISFMSLKLGTVFAGLITLVFMYLLGKEVANKRVGLLAVFFTGIAYWPNVISRIALRFAFYPLFTAPTLYFLVRGIRRQSRNDFILAGIFLGFGLHGYSSFRAVPVLVVIAAGLYALHHFSVLQKPWFWLGFTTLVTFSMMVFLPLLRYITETPEHRAMFSYRFMTRISDLEHPLPGPPGEIFMSNLWRGVTMFFWDDGETWPHSVVHRPAFDVVSATLLMMGVVLLVVRYIHKRDWLDLFWLISIPILLMPSILSLAFPGENPSLNRPGGAYVPAFLIVALALDGLMTGLETHLGGRRGIRFAWGLAAVLFLWASAQNYDLVFKQYFRSYQLSSWNTTELGAVIRGYIDSGIGDENGVWIVGYPHWVDTRLASIIAGYPYLDVGVIPEHMIERSQGYVGPKLFLLHSQAFDSINTLQSVYPGGLLTAYKSKVETKDFWIYFVPGTVPANSPTP